MGRWVCQVKLGLISKMLTFENRQAVTIKPDGCTDNLQEHLCCLISVLSGKNFTERYENIEYSCMYNAHLRVSISDPPCRRAHPPKINTLNRRALGKVYTLLKLLIGQLSNM